MTQHRCPGPGVGALDPGAVEESVTSRFRRVARAHRDCLAVQDGGRSLTYGELEGLADRVAGLIAGLRGATVEPVVLLFHQGAPSVIATLGALAAGRPYAPLDPSDPPAFLAQVAGSLGARLVLTDDAGAPAARALRAAGCQVLTPDDAPPPGAGPPPAPPGPGTAACVYFTSGSTGGPKGVVDLHRNLLHNAARYTAALGIGPADRLSLIQSPGFSGAASSTFAALLNGAALLPMRSGGDRIGRLAGEIRRGRVTIYHSVPSIFRSMVAVDGEGLDHLGIREALVARLPAAMVPATIVFADALPLTPSGKVDRAALAPVPAAAAAAPRGPLEAMVAEVWRDVLEHDDFGVDDDFLAVGGDSLAAAEVLAALEERIGRRLPESLLIRASTVAGLAAELAEGAGGAPASGLVPLQPRGRGAPLVLVHGLDFSTNTYAWLVRRLGAARPVLGLDAEVGSWTSIGDLADGHAGVLRAARPGGPHLIAGFCSGAVVALEVARRLRAAGDEVALLALVGVGADDFPTLVAPGAVQRSRAAARPPRPAERLRALRAAAGRRVRRRRDPAREALARHAPAPLPGDADLYLAAEATALYSRDPAGDWAGLADRVRVTVLPGPNDDLLREPVVAALAARLRAAMDAAAPGPPPVTPPGR